MALTIDQILAMINSVFWPFVRIGAMFAAAPSWVLEACLFSIASWQHCSLLGSSHRLFLHRRQSKRSLVRA